VPGPPAPAIFLGGDVVTHREVAPPPELAPWIATFWTLHCDRPFALRVPPDGCMDIIGDDVVGSLSTALVAALEPGDRATGIRFRPGGFTALYGVPAEELTDLRVPLSDVIRPKPLRALARDAPPPDPLVSAALAIPDVRALARETGWSTRHLRRRLLALTGHTPKRLTRIARMQRLLAAGRGESWARTAVDFGYHDESHMINDVRALTDATPARMLEAAVSRAG
jgi:AraC-like DNA-binding protein